MSLEEVESACALIDIRDDARKEREKKERDKSGRGRKGRGRRRR